MDARGTSVLPVLALLNVFGQHPSTTSANGAAGDLTVTAPARLRSGLIFQVRVQVTAHHDITKPQLIFDPGWWDSMSENSMAPNPSSETNEDGRVVLSTTSSPPDTGCWSGGLAVLPGQSHPRRQTARGRRTR